MYGWPHGAPALWGCGAWRVLGNRYVPALARRLPGAEELREGRCAMNGRLALLRMRANTVDMTDASGERASCNGLQL